MVNKIDLKFKSNDLEGVISENTISFHYGKHHSAYVDNYNKLIEGTSLADMSIEDVLKDTSKIDESIRQAVINNGGGAYNHNLYFEQFVKGGKALSNEELIAKINDTFGSFENMQKELIDCGMKTFGSGWSWLVLDNQELKVVSTKNQDSPISNNQVPLLTLDVWEHAYYLDYQNLRAKHLEDLFKIIDFSVVESRYTSNK